MKRIAALFLAALVIVLSATSALAAGTGVTEEEMTLELATGTCTGVYSGEINGDGLPDGNGAFTSEDEQGQTWTYEGQWSDGHMNGTGTRTWDSGETHTGTYANDRLHGAAVMSFADGSSFDAVFWDDANAIGTYVDADGTSSLVVLLAGQYYAMDVLAEFLPEIAAYQESLHTPAETPSEESPAEDAPTLGQTNALRKAQEYLDFMAFSRNGLVEQLEFEGYSHDEAVYGADHCGADWMEQAAKKAADYVELMAFSRDGLIEQLVYEGFTDEEAAYGAKQVGY